MFQENVYLYEDEVVLFMLLFLGSLLKGMLDRSQLFFIFRAIFLVSWFGDTYCDMNLELKDGVLSFWLSDNPIVNGEFIGTLNFLVS